MAFQHLTHSKAIHFAIAVLFFAFSSFAMHAQAKPAWKDVGGSSTGTNTDGGSKGRKNKSTEVVIVSAPESAELEEGEMASFSVVAQTNDGSNVSYAWFFNGAEIALLWEEIKVI